MLPVHVSKNTMLTSQLRIMRSVFGNQYILVRVNGLKVAWNDVMEEEVAARNARKKEKCKKRCEQLVEVAKENIKRDLEEIARLITK